MSLKSLALQARQPLAALWVCAALCLIPHSRASADIYGFLDGDGNLRFSGMAAGGETLYEGIILEAGETYGVAPPLIKAVIRAESNFNDKAVSRKGAQGLMQLMPETAEAMEIGDPFDPQENILGGARYLSLLLARFEHDTALALAAYNAGPEEVEAHQGIPPFSETKSFVRRVLDFYEQYRRGE